MAARPEPPNAAPILVARLTGPQRNGHSAEPCGGSADGAYSLHPLDVDLFAGSLNSPPPPGDRAPPCRHRVKAMPSTR